MGIRQIRADRKLNNRGSAMVTVIVVVVFVSILATTLLYISVLNYQMKVVDYNTKVTFYEAEVPMEEIRAQLVIDASDAFGEAYRQIISQFATLDSNRREMEFRTAFYRELLSIWDERDGNKDDTIEAVNAIRVIINDPDPGLDPGNPSPVFAVSVAGGFRTDPSDPAALPSSVRLEGVEIQYTDQSNHYTSIIETDFYIQIPDLNWGVDSYAGTWEAGASISGQEMDFQKMVTYVNWTKK